MIEGVRRVLLSIADHSDWLTVLLFFVSVLGLVASVSGLQVAHKSSETKRTRRSSVILLLVSVLGILLSAGVAFSSESFRLTLSQWIVSGELHSGIVWTLVAAIIIAAITHVVRAALLRHVEDIGIKHKIRRTIYWGAYVVFGLCVVLIWGRHLQALGVFLGVFAAGVALSLQETLLCLAGWVLIVVKKPFDIGDRIEVNNTVGDVIDIQTFQTYLLEVGNWVEGDQSTGRMTAIPNSYVFRHKVSNYTKGFPFIWNELKTVLTFGSNWEKAKEIVLQQAQREAEKIENEVYEHITKMQKRFAIHYQNLSPIVYTKIEDIGVALTLRHLTLVRDRRSANHKICEGILKEFAGQKDISFAYPTQTIHMVSAGAPVRYDRTTGAQGGSS